MASTKWSRRAFLKLSAGIVALGGLLKWRGNAIQLRFTHARCVPGERAEIEIDGDLRLKARPKVFVARVVKGGYKTITAAHQLTMSRHKITFEVPFAVPERGEETFQIVAIVKHPAGDLVSDSLEVIARPFHFGV